MYTNPMLDLQTLVKTQRDLRSHRKDESTHLCQQGYIALAQAENTGFESKEHLKKALELFIQALRQNREYIPSYVGLAYILSLLNQTPKALRYIQLALKISPQDTDALELKAYLEGPSDYAQDPNEVADGDNPETVFDLLERKTYALLKSAQEYPARVSLELLSKVSYFNEVLEGQYRILKECKASLLQLEAHFDTLNLQNHIKDIESHLAKYASQVNWLNQIRSLKEQMEKLLGQITSVFKDYQAHPTKDVELALESWLEEYGKLKEVQLDLQDKGIDLGDLDSEFYRLLTFIESFQDHIDFNSDSL